MTVVVDIDDGIAVITLSAPLRRNAISVTMAEHLHDALDGIEADADVRALIITGKGTAFCAGADLSEASTVDDAPALIYEIFCRLSSFPIPTIAAVNGAAVGAGVNLALACDVRLAARSAFFDSRFLKVGLHPGGGHNWLMTRAAGLQATLAMVLLGETVGGERAEQLGLVWRCVDDDALQSTAQSLGRAAAFTSRELLNRTKNTILGAADVHTHPHAVAIEAAQQAWSVRQPAFEQQLASLRTRVAE